jgi:hypothetical protein
MARRNYPRDPARQPSSDEEAIEGSTTDGVDEFLFDLSLATAARIKQKKSPRVSTNVRSTTGQPCARPPLLIKATRRHAHFWRLAPSTILTTALRPSGIARLLSSLLLRRIAARSVPVLSDNPVYSKYGTPPWPRSCYSPQ